MEQKKLTLQEAISAGYTHYMDDHDYARELSEIYPYEDDGEFPEGADLLLPDATQTVEIKPDNIKNLLADWISERAMDIIDEHTVDKIYEHLLKMDYTPIANQINEYCSKFTHYKRANAILVK
jgi:hypothetical protein